MKSPQVGTADVRVTRSFRSSDSEEVGGGVRVEKPESGKFGVAIRILQTLGAREFDGGNSAPLYSLSLPLRANANECLLFGPYSPRKHGQVVDEARLSARETHMSKIFNDLKSARLGTAQRTLSQTATVIGQVERRRTTRARIQIPLLVYSYWRDGMPFYEEAHTIEINANGALIAMRTVVLPGELLLVINRTNHRDVECVVISIAARREREVQVVIAFDASAPKFWWRSSGNFPENVKGADE